MKAIQILTIAAISALITVQAYAQEQVPVSHVKKGFGLPVTQTEPEFPGGADSMKAFIKVNLKYPVELKESRTGGSVMIMFIVDKDGKVTDPIVMKGVNTPIDEEALRIVRMMPDWKPGTAGGMPVSRQYTVTIDFVPPSI